MKALVKAKKEKGLWMEERPIPKMGDDDLLIKIRKTSICGTDIHLYKWDAWAAKTLPVPSIIGHEFVGIVEAKGKNVKGFEMGDRVSGEGHLTCGICRQCRTGRRVLCPNTKGIGVNRDGCFAEYFVLPAENAFPIPDEVPDDMATILDPLGNTVHTALSTDLVGNDVLITGAGPIGMMAVALVKKAGARNIVITDMNDYRLSLAKNLGATRVVNIKKDSLKQVMEELKLEDGFQVCLEMSGSEKALAELPEVASHGGDLILLGILPAEAPINWHQVIFKMLTLKGIYGREIFKTWYQSIHLLQSGLDLSSIVTHRFHYTHFLKGFEVMLSGQCGKVVLDWT